MTSAANFAWTLTTGNNAGAMDTIRTWGSEELQQAYIPKLMSGEWSGTMCLTESHCGSDLGLLRTKAVPQDDGSYRVTGTKIFITAGEHDMSDNIIHIVLARMPDAPEGVKGISLFLVPKFLPDNNGNAGARNGVSCGSIEHKMGLHGSPTCVMNFEEANGFLIGPANRGLQCMFTFMNFARLGVGIQGMIHADVGLQKSLAYARDRLQMRSLSGVKNPNEAADPIIVHPDVRRMLLTQKAFAEGGRMLNYKIAQLLDIFERAPTEAARQQADKTLGLLTPIAKGFLSEVGFESANLALQCFGGHGYIFEQGVEQNVRDSRISCIYEGTTGIQALDLLARKILLDGTQSLQIFTAEIEAFCDRYQSSPTLQPLTVDLREHLVEWLELTTEIGEKAMANADEVGAASVDYLMYSGYLVLAYLWAQAAATAEAALAQEASNAESYDKENNTENTGETAFYQAKIITAEFFFKRLLTRTRGYAASMQGGADCLMKLDVDHFSF